MAQAYSAALAPPWFEAVVEDNMLLVFVNGIIDTEFYSSLMEHYEECGDAVEEILIELQDAIVLDSSVTVLMAVESFARANGIYLGITSATPALKRDLSYPGSCIDWLN
jgi:anti-anti-sigma regulatory factor